METVQPRAGFLSNYEVLHFLRTQRAARAAQIKALTDAKHRRGARGGRAPEDAEIERVQPQDLHTVTFECVKYLEEPVHPVTRQSEKSIARLLDDLETLKLTKTERLQLVNLAPTSLVQLFVCIEDLEERFPTDSEREHLISLVRSHLADPSSLPVTTTTTTTALPPAAAPPRASAPVPMDEDEQFGGPESDDELVDEGLGGGGGDAEAGGRELDEVAD